MPGFSRRAGPSAAIPAMLKDAAFVWDDPLDLEGELTEEERMVPDTARSFAQNDCCRGWSAPGATSNSTAISDRDGRARLPRPDPAGRVRRRGLGHVAYGLIAREIEASIPATARRCACSRRW